MVRLGFVALALVGGCSQPIVDAGELACSIESLRAERGLAWHMLQAFDDGTFSYEPTAESIVRIEGAYDPLEGGFSWTVTHTPESFVVSTEVTGMGTFFPNGDVDVEYVYETLDRSGVVSTGTVRKVRQGCSQTVIQSNAEGEVLWVEEGTLEASRYSFVRTSRLGGYTYEEEGITGAGGTTHLTGGLRVPADVVLPDDFDDRYDAEVTWEEQRDSMGGLSRSARTVLPDRFEQANVTRTWRGEAAHDGTVDYADGTEMQWNYRNDAWGDGTGEVLFTFRDGERLACDAVVAGWSCQVDCPGDVTGFACPE